MIPPFAAQSLPVQRSGWRVVALTTDTIVTIPQPLALAVAAAHNAIFQYSMLYIPCLPHSAQAMSVRGIGNISFRAFGNILSDFIWGIRGLGLSADASSVWPCLARRFVLSGTFEDMARPGQLDGRGVFREIVNIFLESS